MERRGIEPRFAECDSAVIPLDHRPGGGQPQRCRTGRLGRVGAIVSVPGAQLKAVRVAAGLGEHVYRFRRFDEMSAAHKKGKTF